jgi:hypothetical protein
MRSAKEKAELCRALHQGLDERDTLQGEDAAQRRHKDGFARARLQHQTGNRDPRCPDIDRGHPALLSPLAALLGLTGASSALETTICAK